MPEQVSKTSHIKEIDHYHAPLSKTGSEEEEEELVIGPSNREGAPGAADDTVLAPQALREVVHQTDSCLPAQT